MLAGDSVAAPRATTIQETLTNSPTRAARTPIAPFLIQFLVPSGIFESSRVGYISVTPQFFELTALPVGMTLHVAPDASRVA